MVVCIIMNIGFNHAKHSTGTDKDRGSISIGALTITAPPSKFIDIPKNTTCFPTYIDIILSLRGQNRVNMAAVLPFPAARYAITIYPLQQRFSLVYVPCPQTSRAGTFSSSLFCNRGRKRWCRSGRFEITKSRVRQFPWTALTWSTLYYAVGLGPL